MDELTARALGSHALTDDEALALADDGPGGAQADASLAAAAVMPHAAAVRDRVWGAALSFSPKVFLPLTNLCRNRCDYCSFRKSPGDEGAWTMSPDEVSTWIDRARAEGCVEALFCLGDKPESAFAAYRAELAGFGQPSTVEYLHKGGLIALERGLLPHTNAGLLLDEDMVRLKTVNVSLGLMLESASERLCEPGMPHHKAPDKRPAKRLAMIDAAGRLRIPLTTGILIGIGETRRERVESLLAIRALHRRHGHIQEVIIQNFRARPEIAMSAAPEPGEAEMLWSVAVARLILDDEVGLQAPPNLNPASTEGLLAAGINDFGGISPVTPDYINPLHPWPHLAQLRDLCASAGFSLRPRLPIYERYLTMPGFLDEGLRGKVLAARDRMGAGEAFFPVPPPPAGAAASTIPRVS